jgi:phenylalanyl-tRNA synthetase beta chain
VLHVTPPSWRHDLLLEVDLIEEVARLDGYDALPDELRPFRPGIAPDDALYLRSRAVRELLVTLGLSETRPMPFTSKGDANTPRVRNPLADDEPFLRASVLDTLAGRVEYNLSRMQRNVRVFEVGHVFHGTSDRLPIEEVRVGAVIMGDRRPAHFTEPKPPAFDQWDAKAIAERMARAAFPDAAISLDAVTDGSALWNIVAGEEWKGAVSRLDIDAPEWAAVAYGIELSLGVVSSADVAAAGAHVDNGSDQPGEVQLSFVRYRALPTTPAAEFDLALIVPDDVSAAAVEASIRRAAGELLEHVQLFDEYRGANVDHGARSLAWRLTLRHPERTLREKEIEGRRARILELLGKDLGIRPRAT